MGAIKTKDIKSALLKKGFRSDNRDHEYLWLFVGERRTRIRTWLSYGRSEYGEDLLAKVKQQLGVTKKQLHDLVDCPMNHEAYVAHLVATGRIKPD